MAEALREWGLSEQRQSDDSFDDVLLVTSELVTNAIEACFSEVDVEVTGHCDCVEISVTDDNPGQALLGSLTPTCESGRGLQIVARLCSEWGQTAHNGKTKRVWCRVPIQAPPEAISTACGLS